MLASGENGGKEVIAYLTADTVVHVEKARHHSVSTHEDGSLAGKPKVEYSPGRFGTIFCLDCCGGPR